MENQIRIVVVDEFALFRASLAHLLASEPGIEVTGECGTFGEALELLNNSTPDIVLLGFESSDNAGTDFISAARKANYQGHFLIVAGSPDLRKSALSLRAGASGIFLKCEPPERLLKAIKIVADGGAWVDTKVVYLLANQLIDQSSYSAPSAGEGTWGMALDGSERSVLEGILEGLTNRKIGDKLGISESFVKNIIQRLFTRSGVRTRSQLVRIALESSWGTRK